MTDRRPEPPLKRAVRARSGDRCEYCLIPQAADTLTHHLEHVVARKHGGEDVLDQVAQSCERCNSGKGTDLCAIDPVTGRVVRVFDPRRQVWTEHFVLMAGEVTGRTATGRAAVRLLRMNVRVRVRIRAEHAEVGT